MKRVTSADVARASGVSRTTVSFVLNRSTEHTIPASTRERVLRAAQELGYVPSRAGLALAKGRTDIVILDLGRTPIGEYQFGRFSAAFTSELEVAGITAVVHGPDDTDGRSLLRLARALQPFAIVSFSDLGDWEASLRAAGVQLIQGIDFAAIGDDRGWMSEAAELQLAHLHRRGHSSIAFAHPATPGLLALSQAKAETTRQRALRRGMALESSFRVGDDRASTTEAVRAWREDHPDTTALICFNDDVGLAVLAALTDLGIAVPSEVALIGTDDAPSARYAVPAMTTLRSDATIGAEHLARALVAAMHGAEASIVPPHSFTLVVRDST